MINILLLSAPLNALSWDTLTTSATTTYNLLRWIMPLATSSSTYYALNRYKVSPLIKKLATLGVGLLHGSYTYATRPLEASVLFIAKNKNGEWNALLTNHSQSSPDNVSTRNPNEFSEFTVQTSGTDLYNDVPEAILNETNNALDPNYMHIAGGHIGFSSAFFIVAARNHCASKNVPPHADGKIFAWHPLENLIETIHQNQPYQWDFGLNKCRKGQLSDACKNTLGLHHEGIKKVLLDLDLRQREFLQRPA